MSQNKIYTSKADSHADPDENRSEETEASDPKSKSRADSHKPHNGIYWRGLNLVTLLTIHGPAQP